MLMMFKKYTGYTVGIIVAGVIIFYTGISIAGTVVKGDFDVELEPSKIFAPHDTTWNKMLFKVNNPSVKKLSGKIYDLTGAVVSDIKIDTDGSITGASYPLDGMYWDGQDSGGNYVRGGVYIYQIEMDGKVVNGTIVVAK